MAQLPSALACQASRPSRSEWPTLCTAKSTIVVVPPQAAARVPVSKVSEAKVPPNGSSMWVWASTPPGMTYFPVASMVRSAVNDSAAEVPEAARAAMRPSSISTSAWISSDAVMTRPPRMTVRLLMFPLLPEWTVRSGCGQRGVGVRTAVAVELPAVADFPQLGQVEVPDDQFGLLVARHLADELGLRVDGVRRPVEVVVAQLLDAHPVDGTDEVLVGDGCGRLLQLPQVGGQTARGGRRVEDDLGAREAQRPPAFREVAVVADVDTDLPDLGVEDRPAEVAGSEVELLPESRYLGDVVLAVLAEVRAVRVEHGGGVVEDAGLLLLVHRQDEDDALFLGQRLESLDDGAVRNLLGVLVERLVLDLAEVRPVEQLLEAQDLSTLRGRVPGRLLVYLDHRLLVARPRGLEEGGTNHSAHRDLRSLGVRED